MKINTEIILSINVHEMVHFLLKQIDNIKEYLLEDYYIILNCNDYMFNELKNIELPKNILINNEVINKKTYTGKLTEGIYSNMKYAFDKFNFKYFIILSSRNLFYNKLNIDILNKKQKIFLDSNDYENYILSNKNKNSESYNNWHWPSFTKTILAQHYLNKNLNLYGSCHEGLVFHYYVCENIISFLEKKEDYKKDLFNFNHVVEEFSLQTISMNEINTENLYYGFTTINRTVETDYIVPTDPEWFIYKTIRQ